ncbi:MAG: hypothetical protein V4537_15675 [Pseudomonadota bacterium]
MLTLLLLLAGLQAAPASPLSGDWIIDLTARPGDPPYRQPMTLDLKPDGTVTGSFYRSAIEAGRWKTARGRTCVSFRTSDGKGPYHTAACLTGDTVTGQTWAEHRSFLFNWDAVRGKLP